MAILLPEGRDRELGTGFAPLSTTSDLSWRTVELTAVCDLLDAPARIEGHDYGERAPSRGDPCPLPE
jgi:hypothetical protein